RHLGADVIATAGSPSKRALLKTLGVEHVIDSRRGDFAESVLKITGGKGVDVVLNALAGEAIPMGLSCLAEFGRFIEIGKRDIYQNSRIPRSEEHTSELQSRFDLVCRLLLEKKK